MENIVDLLTKRGLVDAVTSHETDKLLQEPITVYIGFDPTADSLHLGNLVGIVVLKWFQMCGHHPIAIVGGATGMIGDPSGKSQERNLLDATSIERNLKGIKCSLEAVLDFDHPKVPARILNNFDWFKDFGYINFLRDIGKHFRMGMMLGKESVRTRLASDEGLSYTEFSYQLLQGYDFLHLYDHYGVSWELGGSDQWGNIIAGTELVRKVRGETVYGLTFPLLTRSDGKKFGKTEEGTIWLNEERLNPYDFYQYLFRMPDVDVIRMMRMLTFMDLSEIASIEKQMKAPDYIPNTAQTRFAEEVTRLIHGQKGLSLAKQVTNAAKPGGTTALNAATLEAISKEIPSKALTRKKLIGTKLIDLLVMVGLQHSKSEARRLIVGGGAYINNEKVLDEGHLVVEDHFIEGRLLLLGVGKKKKMVVRIEKETD